MNEANVSEPSIRTTWFSCTRRVAAVLVVAMSFSAPQTALAKQMAPVAINDAELVVTQTEVQELPSGKLAIGAVASGTGIVECLDNIACHDALLDGTSIPIGQAMSIVLDPNNGRASGQIVIDVIGAGLKGSVKGTAVPAGSGLWDIALTGVARAQHGDRVSLTLALELDRVDGIIGILVSGIVSDDDIDHI